MRNLVRDPRFAGNFAVLMIAKLDGAALSTAAWVFDPRGENEFPSRFRELESHPLAASI
jgi:hypothetical protein